MLDTVIVTGASRGIGLAIVKELLEKTSYRVIAHASSDASLEYMCEQINYTPESSDVGWKGKFPSLTDMYMSMNRLQLVPCDLSNPEQVNEFCKRIKKEWKADLVGLVNNAGIAKDFPLMMQKEKTINQTMQVNLIAPMLLAKAAMRVFHTVGDGNIINISSVVGQTGNSFQTVYAATKAGIIGFTKSLAKEACEMKNTDRIRVNAIAPGFIESQMTDAIPEEMAKKILDKIPMKRKGLPEEIAKVVKFLLSEDSSYLTGEVINVNGGMY